MRRNKINVKILRPCGRFFRVLAGFRQFVLYANVFNFLPTYLPCKTQVIAAFGHRRKIFHRKHTRLLHIILVCRISDYIAIISLQILWPNRASHNRTIRVRLRDIIYIIIISNVISIYDDPYLYSESLIFLQFPRWLLVKKSAFLKILMLIFFCRIRVQRFTFISLLKTTLAFYLKHDRNVTSTFHNNSYSFSYRYNYWTN